MKALIYIEIIENISHNYEKEIIEWAKHSYPDLSVFDFDNFSEPSMVQYAIQLLESAEKALVIIESKADTSGSKILAIAEKILKQKNKVQVILNGENKVFTRMFALLEKRFKKDLDSEEQKNVMTEWFKV